MLECTKEVYKMDYKSLNNISVEIKSRTEELIDFFEIKNLDLDIKIKLWDSIDEFRLYTKNKFYKDVPNWLCGWVETISNTKIIHTLTLNELNKCYSHHNDTNIDLDNIIIHEFVHILVKDLARKKVKKWLTEALAVTLSNQRHTYQFNISLEGLKNDSFQNYGTYQLIGDCLINTKSKDYIIRLIKDSLFLETEIINLYDNFNKYWGNKN
jgi:hypothetical protein